MKGAPSSDGVRAFSPSFHLAGHTWFGLAAVNWAAADAAIARVHRRVPAAAGRSPAARCGQGGRTAQGPAVPRPAAAPHRLPAAQARAHSAAPGAAARPRAVRHPFPAAARPA
ncbi:hypothetical protein G6F23_014224 [Rhizopus arrhizus]|nr:hypothetical protein G6F23_014224 [Rhizopus arrhizus]